MTKTETAVTASKPIYFDPDRVNAMMAQGLTRICNRWAFDTLRTGIDLDKQCFDACIKLDMQEPLEVVLADVDDQHPAAALVVSELRRLHTAAWAD